MWLLDPAASIDSSAGHPDDESAAWASVFSLSGGGLCPPERYLRGRRVNQATGTRGKAGFPVKRTRRKPARRSVPGFGLAVSPRRPMQPSRMRNGCIGSRRRRCRLTGEDRSPPPAATAAPVVRRRPRGAKARPDTSNCRGLPRRCCRRRRSRRVARLMCSRVRRRCTCRSQTAIHAR
jgi:hypothetical protein